MTVTETGFVEAWVDTSTVSKHLRKGPRTVSDYRRRGMPCIQVSERHYIYRLSEVDAWLEALRFTPPAPVES